MTDKLELKNTDEDDLEILFTFQIDKEAAQDLRNG